MHNRNVCAHICGRCFGVGQCLLPRGRSNSGGGMLVSPPLPSTRKSPGGFHFLEYLQLSQIPGKGGREIGTKRGRVRRIASLALKRKSNLLRKGGGRVYSASPYPFPQLTLNSLSLLKKDVMERWRLCRERLLSTMLQRRGRLLPPLADRQQPSITWGSSSPPFFLLSSLTLGDR